MFVSLAIRNPIFPILLKIHTNKMGADHLYQRSLKYKKNEVKIHIPPWWLLPATRWSCLRVVGAGYNRKSRGATRSIHDHHCCDSLQGYLFDLHYCSDGERKVGKGWVHVRGGRMLE